jgi:hypothetical protein
MMLKPKVDRVKNIPLSRRVGFPIRYPKIAAMIPETGRAMRKGKPNRRVRRAEL